MENSEHHERAEVEIYTSSWRGIALEIRHCPNWLCDPGDEFITQHIEVISEGRARLPITETGYRSHFFHGAAALLEFGHDPVAFVMWWLGDAAQSKEWLRQVEADRQYSLL